MENKWKQWQTLFLFWFFLVGGSKTTADVDCSHEIQRRLLLRRKVMTNLDSIFKSRDITCNQSPSSQGNGFSSSHVWMWEFDYEESWAPKNWWFALWCWRRLLRVPWTARRSILKEILKEISPGCSLEGLMLKLKLQYFGHLVRRVDSLQKTLMEKKGPTEDEMAGWHHWLDGRESEWTLGVGDGQGGLVWRLSDWTELSILT